MPEAAWKNDGTCRRHAPRLKSDSVDQIVLGRQQCSGSAVVSCATRRVDAVSRQYRVASADSGAPTRPAEDMILAPLYPQSAPTLRKATRQKAPDAGGNGDQPLTRRSPFRWAICVGFIAIFLSGCAPDGTRLLGCDGAVHPDGTAAIANYTGQGHGGQGWAGNAGGEGGPSAIPPLPSDLSPRGDPCFFCNSRCDRLGAVDGRVPPPSRTLTRVSRSKFSDTDSTRGGRCRQSA
jgi:hypothetical protein